MNLADEIKQCIKMSDVFARYGFEPNRGGFISCPFHSERTASLSAYHDGERWKCFGCGAGGDVISFVMLLFGINFSQALLRINDDFALGLSPGKPAGMRERRAEADRRLFEQRRKRADKKYLNALCAFRRLLWEVYQAQKPQTMDEPLKSGFVYALRNLDALDAEIMELAAKERR